MNDEAKVRPAKAKQSASWVGYRVRLLRDLSTKGDHIFLGGTEMTVLKCFKGLDLADDRGRRMSRVQKFEVTIVSRGRKE